jgi:hypothetical protein
MRTRAAVGIGARYLGIAALSVVPTNSARFRPLRDGSGLVPRLRRFATTAVDLTGRRLVL